MVRFGGRDGINSWDGGLHAAACALLFPVDGIHARHWPQLLVKKATVAGCCRPAVLLTLSFLAAILGCMDMLLVCDRFCMPPGEILYDAMPFSSMDKAVLEYGLSLPLMEGELRV